MPVEEQIQYNAEAAIRIDSWYKIGQKLTISGRTVTKLGFWLRRLLNPGGQTYFEIRRTSDDSLILSKLWGNTNDLPFATAYREVEFDSPALINEEVRIYCRGTTGDGTKNIQISVQDTDVKAGEMYTRYAAGPWVDVGTLDMAYRYTYEAPVGLENKSANMGAKMVGAGLI